VNRPFKESDTGFALVQAQVLVQLVAEINRWGLTARRTLEKHLSENAISPTRPLPQTVADAVGGTPYSVVSHHTALYGPPVYAPQEPDSD